MCVLQARKFILVVWPYMNRRTRHSVERNLCNNWSINFRCTPEPPQLWPNYPVHAAPVKSRKNEICAAPRVPDPCNAGYLCTQPVLAVAVLDSNRACVVGPFSMRFRPMTGRVKPAGLFAFAFLLLKVRGRGRCGVTLANSPRQVASPEGRPGGRF